MGGRKKEVGEDEGGGGRMREVSESLKQVCVNHSDVTPTYHCHTLFLHPPITELNQLLTVMSKRSQVCPCSGSVLLCCNSDTAQLHVCRTGCLMSNHIQ